MKGNKKVANILALFLMFIWGVSYLSIKIVVEEVDPTLSAFYRFFIASVVLLAVHWIKYPNEKILKEDRIKLVLGGLFGVALYFFFENYSVLFTSASNVAILISSIPVFTLVSQRILFKEKLSVQKIIGVLLSAVGLIVIVCSKERVSLFSSGTLGDLMALGAALCWIAYNIVTSKFKGNYRSITITTYQVLYGCIFLSPALFFNKIRIPTFNVSINIIFLALICSCLGFIVYVYCLEVLGATVISTYINLQPIVSLTSAYLLLKESITIYQLFGCGIIITGVFLVSYEFRHKNRIKQISC